MGRSKVKCWIEAMRLRTLPVSLGGVIYAVGLGITTWHFRLVPAILCLLFALLAQIASNFANEYYDFKRGLDRVGRDGPRRGVTEGDITPSAMKTATFATLAVACVVGCVLVALFGEWWMYAVGVLTAIGVMAYSTGPYPLSHHGLGELAVVFFFGVIPVCLTYLLMAIYYANGILALILTLPAWLASSALWWLVPALYLVCHTALRLRLTRLSGPALNPMLGMTAVLMLVYAVGFLLTVCLS